ncbi:LysR family transcriptional regulator [Deinococcus sp.]|uniref:LysR family transcriptional regulator n=1 Tax=Deinococcus sp. TaxID=47478 RepID=UPI003CC5A60B
MAVLAWSVELRQLRLFLALAQEGNFTRAAERVNLSQPALTHRIRALEDELGVPLFLRTSRGTKLTPAGTALLAEAQTLLDTVQLSVERVRRAGGKADEHLRVCFDVVELGSVPPMPLLLSTFRERFPGARMTLQTLRSAELERALLEERLDIAFLFGPPSSSELGFQPLLSGPYRTLLPAAHRLTAGPQTTPTDLKTERLLLPLLNARDEAALLALLPDVRAVHWSAEVASFAGLIAAGEGLGVLPSGLLRSGGAPGLVVRALESAPNWSFGLAWRRQGPPPLAEAGQRLIRQMVPQPIWIE